MQLFKTISPEILKWAKEQKIFWVATAPLNGRHVNCSPKGYDCLTFVDEKTCWYADLTGSGNETISHIYEPGNGRITIMFVAFTGPPRIVRLFGTGKVFERGSPEFEKLLPANDPRRMAGIRSVIWVDVDELTTSCGYAVPFFDYVDDRSLLVDRAAVREAWDARTPDPISCPPPSITGSRRPPEDQVDHRGNWAYWTTKNIQSMDGLSGVATLGGKMDKKWGFKVKAGYETLVGVLIGVVITLGAIQVQAFFGGI